jgi:hypothetical protein
VVQILSDQLDAGAVVAFAETKAHAHSWRRTLVDAYRTSPLLLPRAIANARSGSTLPIERSGTNYRRPSNWTVLRFIARLAGAKLRRFAYGALFEKAWRVATCELPANWSPERPNLPETGWTIPPRPSRFRFLADPFFDPRGSAIFVEAMRGDGRGQIVCLAGTDAAPIGFAGGHCSYPATISIDGRHYVVAEVSDWSPPRLFELDASSGSDRGELGRGCSTRRSFNTVMPCSCSAIAPTRAMRCCACGSPIRCSAHSPNIPPARSGSLPPAHGWAD